MRSAIRSWSLTSRRRAIGARSTIGPIRSASFVIRRRKPNLRRLYEAKYRQEAAEAGGGCDEHEKDAAPKTT